MIAYGTERMFYNVNVTLLVIRSGNCVLLVNISISNKDYIRTGVYEYCHRDWIIIRTNHNLLNIPIGVQKESRTPFLPSVSVSPTPYHAVPLFYHFNSSNLSFCFLGFRFIINRWRFKKRAGSKK